MATIELKKQERNININVQRKIKNDMLTKQYFVAELVKKALDKYLKFEDISVDNSNSIYTLPLVNEDLAIIDFEINALSIHIIPTFDKAKNVNVYIPTLYKQYHYKPDMFLFVNFSKTFTKMEIIGYITEPDLQNTAIPKAVLLSPENLIETLNNMRPRQNKISANSIETTKELMLAYLEKDLSDEGLRFFFKNLISSTEVRKNYRLFYKFNCDFISIARNSHIEKLNPNDNRIELHSRSDYFMDKAISRYNEENDEHKDAIDQITDEEFVAGLYAHQDYLDNEENTLVDADKENNIIELSLEPLNIRQEDENIPQEEAEAISFDNQQQNEEDNNEDTEESYNTSEENVADDELELHDENIIENEKSFDENIVENNINMEENEESFLLQDNEDETFDLSENEPELESEFHIDENNDISDNIQPIAEVEEEILDNATDNDISMEEFSQENDTNSPAIENEDIELDDNADDDDLLSILDENENDNTNITTNIEQEEQIDTSNTEDSGDDLFAFLSEIADESENNEIPNEQNIPQQENYTATIDEQQTEAMQEPTMMQNAFTNQETQMDFHQTNDTIQQATEQTMTIPQNKPKQKSNSMFLLVAAICIGALGTFQYKDKIIPYFTGNNGANDEVALDESIPAPINTEQLENNSIANNADTTDLTAPAPTNNTATPPSPDNAKTLPTLPTTTVEPPKPKHLNDAIATALTKDFNGVRISKLSWEISETLVNKPDVKRYLTIAGKSIKNALAQDLMAATEPSFKDSIVVNIVYKKDGSISKIDVASSSGSQQIDNIVVKSVKDTLNYIKMPALNLKTPEYTAQIVVRL